MMHFLREIRVLREEGKLHKRLIFQLRMLSTVSFILFSIVLFNIIVRGTDPLFAAVLAVGGGLFGRFVFTRMNPLQWNEDEEIVEMQRMDAIGYGVLALYIAVEVGLRFFLTDFFPISATALLLAAVFGALFGRVVGTITEIHRVYTSSHSA